METLKSLRHDDMNAMFNNTEVKLCLNIILLCWTKCIDLFDYNKLKTSAKVHRPIWILNEHSIQIAGLIAL